MLSYLIIFKACAPVFALIGIGYGSRRTRLLSKESDTSLVKLTLNLLFPAFIVDHILGNSKLTEPVTISVAAGTGALFIITGFGLCYLAAGMLKSKNEQRRAFAVTTGLQNYGFIPIPIIYALWGEDSIGIIGILLMHSIGVEIALWTAGIMMLNGTQEGGWKRLMNTPLITTLTCLAANAIGLGEPLHSALDGIMTMLGNCAIPISLLLIGATIYDLISGANESHFQKNRFTEALLAVSLRMILLPLLMLLFARMLPIPIELKRILAIQAAMPAAVFPIILTKQYGGDTETAVRVVIVTTFLSVITIPPVIVFGLWLLGISSP